jgi:hypothetical protein
MPLLASCGSEPTVPSEIPDLRGVWGVSASPWRWADQYLYAPDLSSTSGCAGTLDLNQQSGDSFGGRYTIDCHGGSMGTVAGSITPNGLIRFQLRPDQGWDPGIPPGRFNTPCRMTADTMTYEGDIIGGLLSVNRTQTYECLPGRVYVHASFRGVRQ